ncbi:hypothetical protein EDM02_02080 [Candidatus Cardinium hertigii]|uniref:Uncharacterized protein n=1 Tax=Candidatus Cardinium hertigii TaxID=247481 RepID=A0A3N2QD37_9BACT|nr:hypothetical protein EDM02_02080 [Candidatus Cardinium hertigii]
MKSWLCFIPLDVSGRDCIVFYIVAIYSYVNGIEPINDLLIAVDMIVLLVTHDIFLDIPTHLLQKKIFLDFAGLFPK